jgi:hypothetical protein
MNEASATRCAEALLVAMLAPALVIALVTRQFAAAIPIAMVSAAHAIVLGVPVFLFLRWRGWANAFTSVIGGALVGAGPVALLLFPGGNRFAGSSASVGGVPTMVNGVATEAGWNGYFNTLKIFGAFGAASGLLFWLYLWWRGRNAA